MAALLATGTAAVVAIVVTSGGPDPSESDAADIIVPAEAVDARSGSSESGEARLPDHHGYNDDVLYVALYGSIGTDRLGVLGENDVGGSIALARKVADDYTGFAKTVVPTFEIIASIASFEAGDDGDHSNEAPSATLQPWVEAADVAGYHVVLDLQSGRQRFQSQIREFEALLLEPHVSVALDPEWRVGQNEVPEGGKVGSVSADEVNQTVDYLDDLIVANDLPQKMLIVHQFSDRMISDKAEIRGTENVQVVIHMDGFGSLELKRGTYERVTSNLPSGVVPGWKNFYDEDTPTPSPRETMDNDPQPMFVSFQ